MECSAEIRWFWRDAAPEAIQTWFDSGRYPRAGGVPREDVYVLDPGQPQLSIKDRDATASTRKVEVEIKGLVATPDTRLRLFGCELHVQIWTKWKSNVLRCDGLPSVTVRKTRYLRKFDTATSEVFEVELGAGEKREDPKDPKQRPDLGCNVELTTLNVGTQTWTTLGFESFGPFFTVEETLRRCAAHLGTPALEDVGGFELSYPAWLARPDATPTESRSTDGD